MGIMPGDRDKKWQEIFRRYGISGGDKSTSEKPPKEHPLKEAARAALPEQLLPEGIPPRKKRK
jgi:hypothetical protein